MKAAIHPKYNDVTVRCACGNEIKTRSTKSELSIVLCNQCHPFYTGKQKFVDTAGRIEKFQKKFNLGEGAGVAGIVRKTEKVSKKKVQAAAIQEEKRQKAARKAPKRTESGAEAAEKKEGKAAEGATAPESGSSES